MENTFLNIQQIVAICSVPMAVLDKEMRYIAVSEKWTSLYAADEKVWIGKLHADIFPETSDNLKKIYTECLSGNDQLNKKDSQWHPSGVMRYTESDYLHFKSPEGEIAGMVIIVKDSHTGEIIPKEPDLQLLFEQIPGLCWITDKEHLLKYANAFFYKTLHLTPEVIGRNTIDIIGQEIGSRENVSNEMVLKTNKARDFQQVVRDGQGHPQVYKVYKFPLASTDGSCDLVGSIAFNVTKNTMIDEELYNSEAQFKLAFEHSLIGMALISPDGMLKRVNKSLCKMLGYSAQELIQSSIASITHPEDVESSSRMLRELSTGKIEQTKYEKRYIHKNGSTIWVVIAATMLYSNTGKPLYYVSQIEDITKRKEIENDLVLSEKKYRTIFENVQDVFYQTDQNGIVTEISPSIEQYSGYPRNEIIGQPVANFYFYHTDRDRIIESLRSSGHVIDFEVRLKTKDKQLRYASVNARLVVENGVVVATEGSMRDVTARKFQENALKALNDELSESNQQKSKLLSIIGHDLRNPISGSLQLLEIASEEHATATTAEMSTYLTMISKELSNANNLLEDLLDWAKSQFESVSFNPVHVEHLPSLMQKCVQLILPMATKKNIKIILEVPEELSVTADVAMLETIIRNLLSNAVKFTDEGSVKLKIEKQTAATKFAICDSGIGIPKDKVKTLFSNNVTASTFGTSGERGSGLGLGLCNDFIKRHGGTLWVESEEGKGSTFSFTIPDSLQDLLQQQQGNQFTES